MLDEPRRIPPPESWKHYELWERIKDTINEIPKYFKSTISVSGIRATEIYTFGAVLGITIEEEVVRTLNDLRNLWDPEDNYGDYSFIRQAETFPDVLFMNADTGDIIMGIELKSWYLLAKEGEPSFRFTVSAKACASQDLLVVVPWALSNVLSGTPIIFEPYIELARYVAEYRNHWWKNIRNAKGSTEIKSPEGVAPYPNVRDEISDMPIDDKGKNFGRIARIGIMDEYVKTFEDLSLLGIKVQEWRKFFKEKVG